MNQVAHALEPVYSAYGHDPDLSDIVALFVSDLPGRVARLVMYLENNDLAALARVTQQLRESAERFGFEEIAPCMQELESLLHLGAPRAEVQCALNHVVDMCDRVRPGGPE